MQKRVYDDHDLAGQVHACFFGECFVFPGQCSHSSGPPCCAPLLRGGGERLCFCQAVQTQTASCQNWGAEVCTGFEVGLQLRYHMLHTMRLTKAPYREVHTASQRKFLSGLVRLLDSICSRGVHSADLAASVKVQSLRSGRLQRTDAFNHALQRRTQQTPRTLQKRMR